MKSRQVVLGVLLLLMVRAAVSAANVGLDYKNATLDTILADLSKQSGETITLDAPCTDPISVRMPDIPLDQALDKVSRLAGGVFSHDDKGYRVFPRASAEHVIGIAQRNYSAIKSLEITEVSEMNPSTRRWTGKSHTYWSYPDRSCAETVSQSDGKESHYTWLKVGADAWSLSNDMVGRSHNYYDEPQLGYVGPGGLKTSPSTIAGCDPAKIRGLKCLSAERLGDRIVYVIEYKYDPWDLRRPALGFFLKETVGVEYTYQFPRPAISFGPGPEPACRIKVDSATGAIIGYDITHDNETYRAEGSDLKEVAPGIWMPHKTISSRSRNGMPFITTETTTAQSVKVNGVIDDEKFDPHQFDSYIVSDGSLASIMLCKERLNADPNDANLHFRLAELLGTMGSGSPEAVAEYLKAAELKPSSRRPVLLTALRSAAVCGFPDMVDNLAADLKKLAPRDPDVDIGIAQAYNALGLTDRALQEYGDSVELFAKRADAPLCNIAQLAQRRGDKTRAERLYLEALNICPPTSAATAANALINAYAKDDRLQSLKAPVEAALKRTNDDPELQVSYGTLLLQLRDTAAAMKAFTRAADKDEYTAYTAARALTDHGHLREAEQFLTDRMAHPKTDLRSSNLMSELSNALAQRGATLDEALSAYTSLMPRVSNPSEIGTWIFCIQGFMQNKRVIREAPAKVRGAWAKNTSDVYLAGLLAALSAPDSVSPEAGYNSNEALAAMKQLATAFPDNPSILAILGELCTIKGEYDGAMAAFKKGAELSPDQPYFPARMILVSLLSNYGKTAMSQARSLLAKDPNCPYYHFVMGGVYFNTGRPNDALNEFVTGDGILQQSGWISSYSHDGADQALEPLIACARKLQDDAGALRFMQAAADRAARDADRRDALMRLAREKAKRDDLTGAVDAMIRIETRCMTRWDGVGQVLNEIGDDAARRKWADALANALRNRADLPFCQLALAGLYRYLNMPSEGAAIVQDVLSSSRNRVSVLSRIGNEFARWQPTQQIACDALKRLVDLDPNDANRVLSLARDYVLLNRRDDALKLVHDALNKWPDQGEVYAQAAGIYSDMKLWDDSLAAYQHAIDLVPQGRESYELGMAHTYIQMGKIDEAVALLESLIDRVPEDWLKTQCMNQLVDCCGRKNDKDGQIKWLKRLLSTSTHEYDKVNALQRMASLYQEAKQTDKAVQCFNDALRISKNDSTRKYLRQQIDQLTAPRPQQTQQPPTQ
jgi:tetratricopeptide (TPR) repeat protein